jgi:hypothetical protein
MAGFYGTLAGALTYHADRGNAAWAAAASDAVRTAALVRATDYVKYRYVVNLSSDYDETLPVVAEATYAAALIELATPGFFSTTYTEAQQKVLTEVKGIKWTVIGKSGSASSYMPTSTLIEAMLAPYLAPAGGEPWALVV